MIQSSQKYVNNDEKAMLKEINQSYPVLQCEMNLIASKEQLCQKKTSSIERGMPLCKVHRMKRANHVSCSNVKKRTSDILRGMDMAQKSVID